VRKKEMGELFVTERIEVKRDRGRQRLTYVFRMEKWTSLDLIRSAKDKKMWKSVIANVCRRQCI